VTRDKFLVAATKLINKGSYRGASVDKISAELKVTKGSFYHHNADKDELAAACFERTFGLIEDGKRRADAAAKGGWERLWLATASLAFQQAAGEEGKMLRHYAIAAVPPTMRGEMLARFRQIAHSFAGGVSDGVADGSVRPVDALLAARYLMVVFNAAQPLERQSPGSTDGLMEAYVRPALLGYFVE
jgi:AcrR family transcriptional regulator